MIPDVNTIPSDVSDENLFPFADEEPTAEATITDFREGAEIEAQLVEAHVRGFGPLITQLNESDEANTQVFNALITFVKDTLRPYSSDLHTHANSIVGKVMDARENQPE